MVRHYQRKTQRGVDRNWTMQNLLLVIEAVRMKRCSKYKAALDFGIPEATLRRYLQNLQTNFQSAVGGFVRCSVVIWRRPWLITSWN